MLAECESIGICGIRTYIPEPESRYQRSWVDKPYAHERAYRLNWERTGRDTSYGPLMFKLEDRKGTGFALSPTAVAVDIGPGIGRTSAVDTGACLR